MINQLCNNVESYIGTLKIMRTHAECARYIWHSQVLISSELVYVMGDHELDLMTLNACITEKQWMQTNDSFYQWTRTMHISQNVL